MIRTDSRFKTLPAAFWHGLTWLSPGLISSYTMSASTSKLSQQELRQLMREKAAQKRVVQRIESPLARYDDKNNLSCVVCNVTVHAEALWPAHLVEKAHKKKIEELKQLKQLKPAKLSTGKSSHGLKRALVSEDDDSLATKKTSKFDKIAEFSKKEILIKQSKTAETAESDEETNGHPENISTVIDPSLPQDFFDGSVQPPVSTALVSRNIKLTGSNANHNANEDDTEAGTLPKGFFDDPKLDARSRKGPHAKDPFEEQMELFRKEIAQESIVSEVILEEEIEALQKEKNLDEIEDQITKWEKVEQYQKKIEEIHKKREEEKAAVKQQSDNDSGEEEDQDSLNDMNFWRNKGVFL